MKYKVRLERTDEGVSVSVPGLPGCWSQGTDEKEALENIQEAVREYLASVNDLLSEAEVREIEVTV
jgi:predicted RNase H-like HicB family nuclease